jgi:hypothetical protein
LLAPDVVEEILPGTADCALALKTLERPLPASWDEQREGLVLTRKGVSARSERR